MQGFMMQARYRRMLVALWCVLLVVGSLGTAGTQPTQTAGPAYLVVAERGSATSGAGPHERSAGCWARATGGHAAGTRGWLLTYI